MSADYDQLVGATIQYLEGLKARGVRTVQVSADALRPPGHAGLASVHRAAEQTLSASPRLKPELHASVPALDGAAKVQAFADLRARVMGCVKCPNLVSSRKNVVFGVGNPEAELMFV